MRYGAKPTGLVKASKPGIKGGTAVKATPGTVIPPKAATSTGSKSLTGTVAGPVGGAAAAVRSTGSPSKPVKGVGKPTGTKPMALKRGGVK